MPLHPPVLRRASSVLAGLLAATLFTVPVAEAEELKEREEKVRTKIRRANADLAHSSSEARKAGLRLEAARADLAVARGEMAEVREELAVARRRDEREAADLANAQADLAEAKDALETGEGAAEREREETVDAVVETLQGGDPSLQIFSSLLEADGSADLVRLTEARNVIFANESREYDEMRAAEVLLGVRRQEVAAARDEAAVRREAAAAALEEVRILRDRARQAKAQLRDRVLDRRSARRDAAVARARDARLLERLKIEERRIQARIAAAARRAAQRRPSARHQQQAGGFLRPTAGYISSPFGYRRHPIYGYYGLHDGVDIAAPCGTAVYAPLGGRVLSRYYSDVYGNRLFVGLGFVNGRYLTAVYNHLDQSTVQRGSSVNRGQVVGTVGNTGWSTGCHLHFTLLAGGRAVDPESFF